MRLGAKDSAIVFSNDEITLSIPSSGNIPVNSSTTAMAVYWLLANDKDVERKVKAKSAEMIALIEQKRSKQDGN